MLHYPRGTLTAPSTKAHGDCSTQLQEDKQQ